MCGIAGIFSSLEVKESNLINDMLEGIKSRGPDHKKIVKDKNHHAAFARLSIVDLSDRAMQPMVSSNGVFKISFNGEIYNRFLLKAKLLEEFDIEFKTSSDTEIFLEYISHFGLKNALSDAEGMFAFSLENTQNKTIFFGIDKFGQKPLYYSLKDDMIFYASDLKALMYAGVSKSIDNSKLSEYFTYGYVASPNTLLKDVYKLEAGEYASYNNSNFRKTKYFDIRTLAFKKTNSSIVDLQEKFDEQIGMMTDLDVDYACFLSGGVDSSLIAASLFKCKGNVKTYCVGFPGTEYDESKFAEKISKFIGADHKTLNFSELEIKEIVKNFPNYFSEPLVDFATLPLLLLAHNVEEKVSFVGDGGDELFGGYHEKYQNLRQKWKEKKLSLDFLESAIPLLPEKLKGVAHRFIKSRHTDKTFMEYYHDMQGLPYEKISNSVFSIPKTKTLNNLSFWEKELTIYSYLEQLQNQFLPKLDRSSMSNGLELRAPFLNYEFVKFKFENFSIDFDKRKLQKLLLSKYVPLSLFDRPKKGFSIPFEMWLRKDLNDWAYETIQTSELNNEVLDKKKALNRLQLHKAGIVDDSNMLWKLINLCNWGAKFNIK